MVDSRVTREPVGGQPFGGRYHLLETIGRGRNSVVYKARVVAQDGPRLSFAVSPVALKVIAPSTKHLNERGFDEKQAEILEARVKREALAMLACRHPNVVRLFDYVTSPKQSYVVMEYVDHHDLKTVFSERFAPLPAASALKIILQVLTGLDAIHRQGVIHRDIKPENLLLTSGGTVKIADFGIAVLPIRDDTMADANNGIGTFDYLAPEALEDGHCSVSSDLYALGITCYQLLTGHMPFAAETFTAEITNKLLGRRIPLEKYLTEPPQYLEQLLDRALAPDPADRFSSAAEFSSAVLQSLEGTWQPGPRRPARPRQSLRGLVTQSPLQQDLAGATAELTDHFTSKKVLEAISEGSMETAFRRQGYFGIKGGASGRGNLSSSPFHYALQDDQAPVDHEIVKVQNDRNKRRTWSTFAFKFEQMLKNRSERRRTFGVLLIVAGIVISLGLAALFAPGGGYDLGWFGSGASSQEQKPLVDEIHVGVIFGLMEDESDPSLIITVHPDHPADARLALSIPGWLPVTIDYTALRRGEPVEVRGSGLALTIRDGRVTGEGLTGTYQDAASGRKGHWVIWER